MKYQYWLSNIPGIGSRTIHKLLNQAESAEEIYFLKKEQLEKLSGISQKQAEALIKRRESWNLEEQYEKLCAEGITFLSYEMNNYPKNLKNIVDAPYSIYVKGRMPDFKKKRIAIVGARMCSPYGKAMAKEIAGGLAKYEVQIISGMARGIDSYGHLGALEAGGDTFAVLGNGVNVCYPEGNQKLYDEILSHGGLISEYPPYTKPIAQLFPARNRIISALSDAVIVVEAKERSGSLITADFALEQGKYIFAVPGRLNDSLSQGCNNLIKQGAGMINSVEDFLKDLDLCIINEKNQDNFNKLLLEKDEGLVYACLSLRPKSMEELLRQSGYPMQKLADILQSLIQKEFVTETFKNYYIRKI